MQTKVQGSLSIPACTSMDQALLITICLPFLTILPAEKGEDTPEAIPNRTRSRTVCSYHQHLPDPRRLQKLITGRDKMLCGWLCWGMDGPWPAVCLSGSLCTVLSSESGSPPDLYLEPLSGYSLFFVSYCFQPAPRLSWQMAGWVDGWASRGMDEWKDG